VGARRRGLLPSLAQLPLRRLPVLVPELQAQERTAISAKSSLSRNQSLIAMLNNVELLGPAVRANRRRSLRAGCPRHESPQLPLLRSHQVL